MPPTVASPYWWPDETTLTPVSDELTMTPAPPPQPQPYGATPYGTAPYGG